jgi:DNA-binding response OmpR family regulator
MLGHLHTDLIATELVLPDRDGFQLVVDLVYRGFSVVAVTALDGADTELRARAAGCRDYILKPIDVTTFPSRLVACIGVSHDHPHPSRRR